MELKVDDRPLLEASVILQILRTWVRAEIDYGFATHEKKGFGQIKRETADSLFEQLKMFIDQILKEQHIEHI